ncbi:GNAT family N-acetyltransferase [Pseudooceanicola sediminis]|mgnify:CR=1 FL=1|uniref:GNAT family N-acetyltransferase n=1 Tax=Pseudooceanicola sediminis TaxID=2211117 RepID=A0A399J557_9RHOB|nr:GNAT family N-acetyltransferase [Pseudooceanicola sediminis]KAA2317118.1 GNAT family N-acetyltransferase [Puniceibacterium sp. HSS470]RII40535.1 GNAT family N-acetyltransferase [Pseudooceanicola sediminis]|tara:strand:- start:139985 stop:140431 length:447 start_codon:yes stop_codon:yes gene_type:complete
MIRTARPSDEPDIRSCAEQAYARYVPLMGRKPAPMVADFASQIAARHVHVATNSQDEVQGFIVFYAEGDHLLLENVAVFPSATGRGIGKDLVSFCEVSARRRGLGSVHLYTNEKMSDNLSIYPRLGYVEVDRRVEDGFHRVYFVKDVS